MVLGRTDLRLVLAIGAAGTLLGGARRLRIDHSTAFRRLNSLEKDLGVRLFERSRDGYVPTPAGEAMIATASRVDEEIIDLERQLAGADLRPQGTVRVTVTDTGVSLLMPLFRTFRETQPEIALEIVVANAFFTLSRRDADVAIRPSAEVPEHLIAHRTATVATAPYAAPRYLAAHRRRALEDHNWIGADDSLAHLSSARWLLQHVAPERIGFRVNSLVAMQAAAREGIGVALLPCYLGDVDAELSRVRGPIAEMAVSLWVLIHPDLRRTARVRTFVDFIVPELGRLRPLIEGRARAR
jgi:DNA-binding transcriptional LysR family regulator